MYVTELFPTRMRGLANAVVLFASKMIGALAPVLCTLSKKAGYHVLCGCSILVLLSIPCSFLIKETLVAEKQMDKVVDQVRPPSLLTNAISDSDSVSQDKLKSKL